MHVCGPAVTGRCDSAAFVTLRGDRSLLNGVPRNSNRVHCVSSPLSGTEGMSAVAQHTLQADFVPRAAECHVPGPFTIHRYTWHPAQLYLDIDVVAAKC